MRFADDSCADYEYELMNFALYDKAYALIKDYPLQTTEEALRIMEELAIANILDCFDLRFRMISLRVIVNMDVFMDGENQKSSWGEYTSFNEKVENENSETLDIFEPAMHNLFNTGRIVIDALLGGELDNSV